MEALEILKGTARQAKTAWHGQWDGRYVAIVDASRSAGMEVGVVKVGSVTRYRCGTTDVLILEPHSSVIDAHAMEVLRELRLLPQIGADAIVVTGPKHVLESASARLSMHGIRSHLHGRELRVRS